MEKSYFQDILTKKGIRAGSFDLWKNGKKRFNKTIAIEEKSSKARIFLVFSKKWGNQCKKK